MNATLARPRHIALSTPPASPEDLEPLQEKPASSPTPTKISSEKAKDLRDAATKAVDSVIEIAREINAKQQDKPT